MSDESCQTWSDGSRRRGIEDCKIVTRPYLWGEVATDDLEGNLKGVNARIVAKLSR